MANINDIELLNNNLMRKNDALEDKNAELKEQIKDLESELEDLKYNVDCLQCQNKALTQYHETLERNYMELHKLADSLSSKFIKKDYRV